MTQKNEKTMKRRSVSHLLQEKRKFLPPKHISQHAHIKNLQDYEVLYKRSIDPLDTFWLEQAANLHWFKSPTIACKYEWNTQKRDIKHTWFEDGLINVSGKELQGSDSSRF